MFATLVLEQSKSSLLDIIVVSHHQRIVLYNDRSHHSCPLAIDTNPSQALVIIGLYTYFF